MKNALRSLFERAEYNDANPADIGNFVPKTAVLSTLQPDFFALSSLSVTRTGYLSHDRQFFQFSSGKSDINRQIALAGLAERRLGDEFRDGSECCPGVSRPATLRTLSAAISRGYESITNRSVPRLSASYKEGAVGHRDRVELPRRSPARQSRSSLEIADMRDSMASKSRLKVACQAAAATRRIVSSPQSSSEAGAPVRRRPRPK